MLILSITKRLSNCLTPALQASHPNEGGRYPDSHVQHVLWTKRTIAPAHAIKHYAVQIIYSTRHPDDDTTKDRPKYRFPSRASDAPNECGVSLCICNVSYSAVISHLRYRLPSRNPSFQALLRAKRSRGPNRCGPRKMPRSRCTRPWR